ncbi:MAG: nitroreductase family protein [Candidatus Acidiferrales bacterium]
MSILEKPAEVNTPINGLLARRWSPRAFDSRDVEPEKLRALFEAARWSASSGNQQPWHFLLGTSDAPENFKKVLECLVESNQAWAKNAPVLGLTVAALKFANSDQNNRYAFHDVGQAMAYLTVEAMDQGLFVHQMGGILPDKAREVFQIPEGYEAVAGFAIGYRGDPSSLPDKLRERELAARVRKPMQEFVFSGQWGKTASMAKPKG